MARVRQVLFVSVAVFFAAVGACSDSDDDEAADTSPTTVVTTPDTTVVAVEDTATSTDLSTTSSTSTTVSRSTTTSRATTTTTVPASQTTVTSQVPIGTTSIEVGLGRHPQTNQLALYVVYRWEGNFDPNVEAVVTLVENGVLVGRQGFGPTPGRVVSAYFDATESATGAIAYGTGVLTLGGNNIDGTLARTTDEAWPVRVNPGQIQG